MLVISLSQKEYTMNRDKLEYLRQKTLLLPTEPGIYKMLDKNGKIIYIGKAKSLKNRVGSYFRNIDKHTAKVYKMVENVNDFDYIVTDSEFEALILECSLIKLHSPKYNILLKDDKGYSYIRVSSKDYGRITAEKQKDPSSADTYFGPYISSMVAKETVDEAVKAFMLPTCNLKFPEDFRKSRPCLNYHIKQCMGVCTGKVTKTAYDEAFSEAVNFIKDGGTQSIPVLTQKMEDAAISLDFEKAARYRDRINAITKLSDKQKVVSYNHKSLDAIAMVSGGDMAYIAVLVFRKNRLRDKKSFVVDFFESAENVMESFLLSYYDKGADIPSEIFLDVKLDDAELISRMLSDISGKKNTITHPQRGLSRELVDMARNNAAQELSLKTNRSGKEITAIDSLGKLLGMNKSPMYIEAYDISNIGGQTIVGGMAVFEKGRPLKKHYRKFTIKDMDTPDDYASMRQMLTRRFTRYLNEEETDSAFKTLPDLLLIDGGQSHVNVAKDVIETLGLDIAIFGMVKDNKHRTRAISAGDEEIVISSNRSVFSLVTSIQDEVHRYSIDYSRKSHTKASLATRLTAIEGVGQARANALYKYFKTYKALSEATLEEIIAVKGVTQKTAENIYAYIHKD